MEKAKFLEAKKQVEIIDVCEDILLANFKELVFSNDPFNLILKMLKTNSVVRTSFLRWVENEKSIAEQKLKEI